MTNYYEHFHGITNQSPEILVPGDWAYASTPGTFFWSGLFLAFAIGMVCMVAKGFKSIIGVHES